MDNGGAAIRQGLGVVQDIPLETGICPLPRAETAARELMDGLGSEGQPPGQLYGVLVVQTATGERRTLKGFSGTLARKQRVPGWVPPLPVQQQIALLEPLVLARLDHLKAQLVALGQQPEQAQHRQWVQQHARELEQLAATHRQRKQSRDRNRHQYHSTLQGHTLTQALDLLKRESQRDSAERRQLKQAHRQTLEPLSKKITQTQQHIQELKHQYAILSRRWQQHLETAYGVQGDITEEESLGLEAFTSSFPFLKKSLSQRAAAKLLYYAASQHLTPLAMAEFWWGPPAQGYYPRQFYDVSPEESQSLLELIQSKAQPIKNALPITILHQDEALIVVNKPAGLLSVPGRRYHQQDSVLSRLRRQLQRQLGNSAFLRAVHRLDQSTSGILILVTSPTAHKILAQQFAQRRVEKTYEALLSRPVTSNHHQGTIDLPLWGNPDERPRQWVNHEHGKPSITHFQMIETGPRPRIQFRPRTGRTHQLRVHAAHPQGLNSPILGDSLYGEPGPRLHLHATSLQLLHPSTRQPMHFTSTVPF